MVLAQPLTLASRNQSLHLIRLSGNICQVLMTVLSDENVVLDTAKHVLFQNILIDELAVRRVFEIRIDNKLAEVDLSRLNCDNAAARNVASHAQVSEHLILVGEVGVASCVVSVHAEVMAQSVREEGSAGASLEDLVLVALENASLEQTVNGNFVGKKMNIIPEDARLEDFGVVVPLATSIHQQVELALQRSVVSDIVQGRSSPSRGSNGVVGHLLDSVGNTSLKESSLELLLVLGSLCPGENSAMSNAGDIVGLSKHGNLELVLDHSGDLDGILQDVEVLVVKFDEGDMVRDLFRDGKG
ncbi:hypothetical protein HG530_003860 [Fusarium avenaceum]|nr:hypothetical protein HG530_003860 [Fusarium avenaceum]